MNDYATNKKEPDIRGLLFISHIREINFLFQT